PLVLASRDHLADPFGGTGNGWSWSFALIFLHPPIKLHSVSPTAPAPSTIAASRTSQPKGIANSRARITVPIPTVRWVETGRTFFRPNGTRRTLPIAA